MFVWSWQSQHSSQRAIRFDTVQQRCHEHRLSRRQPASGSYALIDEVVASGEPVLITGMESKAVLISEEVWRGIQATLDLVSIPGMRASIRDGMGTAHHELSSEPLW